MRGAGAGLPCAQSGECPDDDLRGRGRLSSLRESAAGGTEKWSGTRCEPGLSNARKTGHGGVFEHPRARSCPIGHCRGREAGSNMSISRKPSLKSRRSAAASFGVVPTEARNGLTGSPRSSDWSPPSAPVAGLGSINPPTNARILPLIRILTRRFQPNICACPLLHASQPFAEPDAPRVVGQKRLSL
jgi:hypothetical protein